MVAARREAGVKASEYVYAWQRRAGRLGLTRPHSVGQTLMDSI